MRRQTLINLRNALRLAEVDIGISDLSASEKEFFYDILQVATEDDQFTSDQLRECPYSSSLPHATYHRLLTRLQSKGFIQKAAGRERNCYFVTSRIQSV